MSCWNALGLVNRVGIPPVTKQTTAFACCRAAAMPSCKDPWKNDMVVVVMGMIVPMIPLTCRSA